MNKWIAAARLRTLPLSLSGIFLGTFLAAAEGKFDWKIFSLACITTLFLQILSNYANDYGDGIKGTDNERVGEKRAVASGEISSKEMKIAVIIFAILSILSSLILLYVSFWNSNKLLFWVFVGLGLASVLSAILYTVGNSAYGYKGFGDLFVFVFFGLIGVGGSYLLYTKNINPNILLPASAIGLLSTAVLNLNNMRDIHSDRKAGKNTLVVKMGFKIAKYYHAFLLLTPFILGYIYLLLEFNNLKIYHFLIFILLIPAILLLKKVFLTTEPANLDGELKKTAFLTLSYAIIFGLILN